MLLLKKVRANVWNKWSNCQIFIKKTQQTCHDIWLYKCLKDLITKTCQFNSCAIIKKVRANVWNKWSNCQQYKFPFGKMASILTSTPTWFCFNSAKIIAQGIKKIIVFFNNLLYYIRMNNFSCCWSRTRRMKK
jgi:hypothetical protein